MMLRTARTTVYSVRHPSRSRNRTSPRKSGLPLKSIGALALLAGACLGGGRLFMWSAAAPHFNVSSLSVSELKYLNDDDLISELKPALNQNIIKLNLKNLEEKLEGLPYVEEARIYRSLPSELYVNVTERDLLAMLDTGDGLKVMDFDGRLVASPRPGEVFDLPIISGCASGDGGFIDAVNFLRSARTFCPRVYAQISQVVIEPESSELTIIAGESVSLIKIGRGLYRDKVLALWILFERSSLKLEETTMIDLRFPQKIYYSRG